MKSEDNYLLFFDTICLKRTHCFSQRHNSDITVTLSSGIGISNKYQSIIFKTYTSFKISKGYLGILGVALFLVPKKTFHLTFIAYPVSNSGHKPHTL